MKQSTLQKLRNDARVEHVDDERAIGNSVIVSLNSGWRFRDIGEHVFGEDTLTQALQSLKGVKPCNCCECAQAAKMPKRRR